MEVLTMESNKVDTEWKWLQPISEELFKEKYMLQNEKSVNDVFTKVAEEVSSVESPAIREEIRDKFYNAMKDGEFIPGGRILSNARPGSPIKNYNNCFTIAIEDSMDGIFDALKEDAAISKVGGGVGLDASPMRPKGSPLSKGGEASGPISFLKIFNQSAKTIKTGGFRRAAHIALMDISHPDIEEFITIKQGDRNKELSNFNLSVKITDEFIEAYKNDRIWQLKFNGKVYKTVRARELYELLAKNAYVHNEPGIFNQDTVERYNNGWWAFNISCVNPCITGDTLIAVADGRDAVRIDELAKENKDIPVYCQNDNGNLAIKMMRNPRVTGYNQDIYEVELDDGSKIKCTGNHKFILRNGNEVEAINLNKGDSLKIASKWKTNLKEIMTNYTNKNIQDYWMINDGNKNIFEHRFIYEKTNNDKLKNGDIIHHKDRNGLNNCIDNLKKVDKQTHDKLHDISGKNNPYYKMSKESRKKFASHPGKQNGMYSGISTEEIFGCMEKWIKENDRAISIQDWDDIAKEKDYPINFKRKNENIDRKTLIDLVNEKHGKKKIKNKYIQRNFNRFLKLQKESDLELYFIDGHIKVKRYCEHCEEEFFVGYDRREYAYCSVSCSDTIRIKKMQATIAKNKDRKHKKMFEKFIDIFSEYINKNKKLPMSKEINEELKKHGINDTRTFGITYRNFFDYLRTNYHVNIDINKIGKNENYRKEKAEELIDYGMVYNHKIVSVKHIGNENVYNGTVDEFHNYGIVLNKKKTKSEKDKLEFVFTPQCGEIVMPPYNLCCLSSINFSKLIRNPFTQNAQFDFNRYRELVNIGIRFLDNVLDVAEYPLEKIENNSRKWRRIGLGFTGLGDAFAMMKMKYGSKKSKLLSHEIGKVMRNTAYESSIELAKEKGPFPECDKEKLVQANFIKNLPRDIQVQIAEHGLRNIQMLTVPPTGTISLTVGNNCSSGIEPIPQIEYQRNVRTGIEDETRKEVVYDYAWLKYKEQFNGKEEVEVPDYFSTIVDVDPYDSIDIQSIFQQYIDHSISKTLNLPPNTTFDQYKDLFLTAYDKGLKGFTSFNPQGSLKGILEYANCTKITEARPIYIERNSSPKRPQDLECDIHEISVSGLRHIVLVGKLNGTLYEMFVTHNPENKIDLEQNKVGIIRKAKKGRYNLIVKNGEQKTMIEDIGSIFDKDYGTFSRLISTALRHGVPLSFLVDQLSKDKNFVSFGRSVSRILKKYIKDGEWVITSDKCDECKGELVYQEGCKKCISCGWTKCD